MRWNIEDTRFQRELHRRTMKYLVENYINVTSYLNFARHRAPSNIDSA